MRFARDVDVGSTPEETWRLLWDVQTLAQCIPGCGDVTVVEEGRSYRAIVTARIGPFSVTFPLEIMVTEVDAPRHVRLTARGEDPKVASRLKGELDLTIARAGSGTRLAIVADVLVHGRLASLGEPVIVRRAERDLQAFAAALVARLSSPEPVG